MAHFFNWKLGLASAVYRGILFFAMTLPAGWRAAMAAALVEAGYRGVVSGLDGALLEAITQMAPPWFSALMASAGIPAAVLAVEYAIHAARGTPNLEASVIVSIGTTSLFTVFNWHAIRSGIFLTGHRRTSFVEDVRRLPGIAREFVMAGPRAALRAIGQSRWSTDSASVTKTSPTVHAPLTADD